MDAGNVLGYLGSLASIASYIRDAGPSGNITADINAFIDRVPKIYQSIIQDDPEAHDLIDDLIMDQGLFDDFNKEIKDAEKEYRKTLKGSGTFQGKAAADRDAEALICDTLNRIKRRNNRKLPTDYLRKRWDSYGCVDQKY